MFILGVLGTLFSLPLARALDIVYVKANSSYAALIAVQGTPLSFMKDNVSIPRGSSSDPCIEGRPCWQLLSNRSLAELKSDNVSGNGTIIVTPSDSKKSPTEIFVRDLNGTSRSVPLPRGVGQTEVLKLDPQRKSSIVLLYNETVQITNVSGNIQIINNTGGPADKRWLIVPYLSTLYKGKSVVLLTGYFGTSNERIDGELAEKRPVTIPVIGNPNAPDYKILRVSFRSACAVNTWNVMLYVLSLIVIKANT